MSRTAVRRHRPGFTLGAVALIAFASLLAAAPADAQMIHLFGCKVVCGYQPGNVRLLNDPAIPINVQPEDLKPGNYATTCNIFNYDLSANTQTVLPYLAVEGGGLIFLGAVTVGVLNANAYGCRDIVANLPAPFPGPVFEGYLTLFTFDPDFKVDSVHTFESQNAFERHVVWQYNPFGPISIFLQSLGLTIPRITNPIGGAGVLARQAATASGAGGLGLGASIDVEDVRRIDINLDTTSDEERERLPPEVREVVGVAGDV